MSGLIALERSGIIRDAFLAQGIDCISCDQEETLRPGPHIRCDVREILYEPWDFIIAHPPCPLLTNTAVWCLHRNPKRWRAMQEAAQFFNLFLDHPCKLLCAENPVPHGYAQRRFSYKYTQTIQPYQFGHPESKRTCLWLKGFPKLKPTNILRRQPGQPWENQTKSGQNKLGSKLKDRAFLRAKTYSGIAEAMALQWSQTIREHNLLICK